jgi:U4/U6 small nuclear ribonucleoprotein PRP3
LITIPQKPTKAPVLLRLDAAHHHGNVVNVTKPTNLSTLKVNINKQKKDAFEIDTDSNPHFDERIGINKTKLLRRKRKNFLFVEQGKMVKRCLINNIEE